MSIELERAREKLDVAVQEFIAQRALEDEALMEDRAPLVTAESPLLVTAWVVIAEGTSGPAEAEGVGLRFVGGPRTQMVSTSLGLASHGVARWQ